LAEVTLMLAGGLTPNQGLSVTLDRLTQYAEQYKVSGLKLYTFDATAKKGWWFDDEKLAYPMWEKCASWHQNIGCHKGIPFGQFYARYAHAEDFDAVADDFLDLNFIAYHSAWPYHNELAALKTFKPQRKNMYCEVARRLPLLSPAANGMCACPRHSAADLGPDYVLWGTDSLLWGNPQWQIEAFRKFQIPTNWSRATVIRRSPTKSVAKSSARMRPASGTSTSRRRCRQKSRFWKTRPSWPDFRSCRRWGRFHPGSALFSSI